MSEYKVRENRIRRKLDRMGYRLSKSRRRDPDAIDYRKYAIIDKAGNYIVAGTESGTEYYEYSLDDVEAWIKESRNK